MQFSRCENYHEKVISGNNFDIIVCCFDFGFIHLKREGNYFAEKISHFIKNLDFFHVNFGTSWNCRNSLNDATICYCNQIVYKYWNEISQIFRNTCTCKMSIKTNKNINKSIQGGILKYFGNFILSSGKNSTVSTLTTERKLASSSETLGCQWILLITHHVLLIS